MPTSDPELQASEAALMNSRSSESVIFRNSARSWSRSKSSLRLKAYALFRGLASSVL
jgi:hypothetical protein